MIMTHLEMEAIRSVDLYDSPKEEFMLDDMNGILADMTGAIIAGRGYREVIGADRGIMREDGSDDIVLVQRHKDSNVSDYKIIDYEIMRRCINEKDDLDDNSVEDIFSEIINKSRRFKSIVVPFNHLSGEDEEKNACSYTVAELPKGFCDKYKTIDAVYRRNSFAFHSRVVMSLNLAEAFLTLEKYFYGCLRRLVPEAIYVNTDDADVKIIIDRLLSRDIDLRNADDEYLRIICDDEETINRSDLLRYLVYTSFRLICIDNPYDGKDTLIQFPLLTSKAFGEINSGNYGFIFSKRKDEYSEYIDKEALQRWNLLPGFIKQVFSDVLDNKRSDLDVDDWLKYMRILRDCLVLVNGQFKLCDPDVSNKVSFLVSDEFRIPIWPRKAVYWYHVGILADYVTKEIIAGINAEGFIENMTNEQWVIENESKVRYLAPGKSIKPEIGMDIEINNTHFKVVSGEKAIRTGMKEGDPPDYSGLNINQDIAFADLNEE